MHRIFPSRSANADVSLDILGLKLRHRGYPPLQYLGRAGQTSPHVQLQSRERQNDLVTDELGEAVEAFTIAMERERTRIHFFLPFKDQVPKPFH